MKGGLNRNGGRERMELTTPRSLLPLDAASSRQSRSDPENVHSGAEKGSLVVQCLRLRAPNAGGLGSILGQGTRFHMATTKDPMRCS